MFLDKIKKDEPKDSRKFYTLSAVAYSCLADIGENESRFLQFLNWAKEGYRDWNIDQAKEVHVVEIEMPDYKQIQWPCDMIDWSKVGIKCGDMVKTFTTDRNIPRTFETDEECNKLENGPCPDIDNLEILDLRYEFYNHGELNDKLFGWGVKYNYLGYFDVDRKNRTINFKETIDKDKKVYLEYISDGINYSGKTLVNPIAFKLLKLYVHWMRRENNDRYSLGAKQRAERLYKSEMRNVSLRMLDLTLEDIQDALRQGYTLVPEN